MIAAVALAAVMADLGKAASADEAMVVAIPLGCVLHATGMSPIDPTQRAEVAAAGLELVASPPPAVLADIAGGTPAAWGKATVSRITWPNGSAWVIGFAKGACLIDATDTDGNALLQAIRGQFGSPGVPWKQLSPAAAQERYGMAVQRKGAAAVAIVANMVGMDVAPFGRREIVTFETTPNK